MADDNKKPSIFQKVLDVGSAMLDAQLVKTRNTIASEQSDFNFGKAITKDRTYYLGSQGFQEKPSTINFEYQKQMAIKSSIVAAIIKTRQNQVASHSQYVPEGDKPGFRVVLKHEQAALDEIKEELFGEEEDLTQDQQSQDVEGQMADSASEINKAELGGDELNQLAQMDPNQLGGDQQAQQPELSDEDKDREAKKELEKKTKKKKEALANFLLHCGELKERPFESKKWTLDGFLRATVSDSLTYDQIAIERIPKEAEKLHGRFNIHHFQPIDGSTVRYASPELKKYKSPDMNMGQDILYNDDEIKALGERDALKLDDERLENDEYKYVQVIRGRIMRAFTEDELAVGMRNPATDIYANGYSISELELLVALVTSHLQTEFYNRAYFQQGFSAKGILHIKANLNRSKLEELRRHWNHMVKGNRNSFQTPIMSGMDEVQWIPLTQSHSEMEFSLWLNYLIRMICAIYQIDPSEIGYGMKDEGKSGMSGDNTKEKMAHSKSKGFIPLMMFLQDFINKNIIDELDPDYMIEWTGLDEESEEDRIKRQSEEVKFKKSVNEIRAEEGLPPIKGADHLILDPVYFQWYSTMSEEGKALQQEQQQQQMAMAQAQPQPGAEGDKGPPEPDHQQQWKADEASKENDHMRNLESKTLDHQNNLAQMKAKPKGLAKSMKIEYYRLDK